MSDLKANLSDKVISRLPFAEKGQYIVRDTEMRGFFLVVGTRRKTFTVQADYRKGGARTTKRIAIGIAGDINTRDARIAAKAALADIATGKFLEEAVAPTPSAEITLRQAWDRYRSAHLQRKERSERTIRGYSDHVEHMLKEWLDKPLKELGENPALVSQRHDELTKTAGPYAANGCMRTLRAIYNHARRSVRGLPPENPVMAVDWNEEKRRDVAMGAVDISRWMTEAGRLRNPVRREFHLFTVLCGSRPTALKTARIEHLNLQDRVLHIPSPKGGKKKAFDIPLSRPMLRCLVRAMRAGRMLYPDASETWLFAADSAEGHIIEHKENRHTTLSKWGNDLRHTYRTLGQAAGLSPVDMHLLMNHSVRGVNEGYITRSKLLNDHLRTSQQTLSDFIIRSGTSTPKSAAKRERAWPLLPSRLIGDEALDPTPPDPRLGKPLGPRRRKSVDADEPAEAA